MPTCIKISGAASALLALAALLAAGARADWITTAECEGRSSFWGRIRQYPTDSDATVLAMDGCSLKIVDPAAFPGLPNVNTVDLDENNIESINPAVFHTVPTLTKLRLSRNKLRELPVFDERSCANWTSLYLSFNKLRMIDNAETFSACTKVQWLELEYNSIEHIHPNAFSALTVLRRLSLNNNKITFVPDELFGRNDMLTHLTLSNNRITYLPSDFASSRKLAGVGFKTFKFNGNPWHCACLVELLADVQRAGVTYYKSWDSIRHYEGTLPECNFMDTLSCGRDAPSAAPGRR